MVFHATRNGPLSSIVIFLRFEFQTTQYLFEFKSSPV
jgi:hypothetical protein